jgi:cell division protease FtsH
VVPNPDILGREKILRVHMRKVPIAPDVDPRVIARGTPGFSGADLANLVNEAALIAARASKRVVTQSDFEAAKDKVMLGTERRSMVMTEEDKRLTAYHEAGHALVSLYVPGNDPLHKVTIIPRGQALGLTFSLPERDRLGYKKSEILAKLAMTYGGRAAEEIIFGKEHITTGAGSDIRQATGFARRMVTEWGMSEKLGAIRYNDNQDEVFLGHSVSRTQSVSGATAKLIDEEVREICDNAEAQARKVLTDHLAEVHLLAKALLEHETLGADEVQQAIRGEKIDRGDGAAPVERERRSSVPSHRKTPRGNPGIGPEPEPAG